MVMWIGLGVVGLLAALLLVAFVNAIVMGRHNPLDGEKEQADEMPDYRDDDAPRAAQHLSRMVQIPTVSHRDSDDYSQIYRFHALLEELYPLLHQKTTRHIIGPGALLFHWASPPAPKKQTNPKRPILLMSHMDVVEAPSENRWDYPPFGGTIAGGKIWGRGTVDTKGALCAILETAERLLEKGFVPQRDIYIASSYNEEITGDGAVLTVDYLAQMGVRLDLVMDEGGAVMGSLLPGVSSAAAMVGILEKGRANVLFSAHSPGGHASTPFRHTPLARLAAFIRHVETRSPFKKRIIPEVRRMYRLMAPMMNFPYRFILGNLWLFGPAAKYVMAHMGGMAGAMVQSTCVFTQASGSEGANVIPETATVTANLRFMPFDSMNASIHKLLRIAAKYKVEGSLIRGYDVCPSANTASRAYAQAINAIKTVFGAKLPIIPYIMLAGTDARHYTRICDTVLRFVPLAMNPQQLASAHALNENLDVAALEKAVAYYTTLLQNYD